MLIGAECTTRLLVEALCDVLLCLTPVKPGLVETLEVIFFRLAFEIVVFKFIFFEAVDAVLFTTGLVNLLAEALGNILVCPTLVKTGSVELEILFCRIVFEIEVVVFKFSLFEAIKAVLFTTGLVKALCNVVLCFVLVKACFIEIPEVLFFTVAFEVEIFFKFSLFEEINVLLFTTGLLKSVVEAPLCNILLCRLALVKTDFVETLEVLFFRVALGIEVVFKFSLFEAIEVVLFTTGLVNSMAETLCNVLLCPALVKACFVEILKVLFFTVAFEIESVFRFSLFEAINFLLFATGLQKSVVEAPLCKTLLCRLALVKTDFVETLEDVFLREAFELELVFKFSLFEAIEVVLFTTGLVKLMAETLCNVLVCLALVKACFVEILEVLFFTVAFEIESVFRFSLFEAINFLFFTTGLQKSVVEALLCKILLCRLALVKTDFVEILEVLFFRVAFELELVLKFSLFEATEVVLFTTGLVTTVVEAFLWNILSCKLALVKTGFIVTLKVLFFTIALVFKFEAIEVVFFTMGLLTSVVEAFLCNILLCRLGLVKTGFIEMPEAHSFLIE